MFFPIWKDITLSIIIYIVQICHLDVFYAEKVMFLFYIENVDSLATIGGLNFKVAIFYF